MPFEFNAVVTIRDSGEPPLQSATAHVGIQAIMRAIPFLLMVCAANIASVASVAFATGYPVRPVRMMVPFPPGGANDIVARLTAQQLSARWNLPVVIDNRAGAGGNVGTEVGARAVPDGHTLTIGSTSTYITNVALEPKLPFDPRRDFAPIALIVTAPNILEIGRAHV
mgnify:CR=1 FL=1